MPKKILFILAILPIFLLGQETKKVTQEYKNSPFKEVYYVLKSEKSIRQGNYQKLGYKGAVIVNGFYKNGLKDSVWTEYRWDGKTKAVEGNYSKDSRTGIWTFYDFKGEIEQTYNFDKNEVLFFKNEDVNKEYNIITESGNIKTKLERPPLFIGGVAAIAQIVSKNISYPIKAREDATSGKVMVAFIISANGTTSNHKVIKSIGSGCDEEALRVVKLIPDNLIPALLGGQLVNAEYVLPISFQLN
jgi:periplasmic protein TonB